MMTNTPVPTDPALLDVEVDELPLWMRRARQQVDWGVLIVLLLGMLVVLPFTLRQGLPQYNASENYVFAAADYADAFREGRLYPRWSPAAISGYGAPIPHFYAPAAPYSAAFVDVMFANNPTTAVKVIYVASLLLAGSLVYAFVMRRNGAAAGVLAGTLYLFSPYVMLTAPHLTGDLPGVMGLAFMPLLLWSTGRLMRAGRPLDFTLLALATALLILTDVRYAAAGGLLALLVISLDVIELRNLRRGGVALLAGTMGVLLGSFYWLPALLEQDTVRWLAAAFEPVSWSLQFPDVFLPPASVDLAQMLPVPAFTIGLVLPLFGLIAFIGLVITRQARRWRLWSLNAAFLLVGIIILVAGVLLWPDETWLLAPVTLCLAIGGSASLVWMPRLPESLRKLLLPVSVAVVLVGAFPAWLSPVWHGNEIGNVNVVDQVTYEQQGFGVAVLPPGAPVPVTVPDPIEANTSLISSFQAGNVARVSRLMMAMTRQLSQFLAQTHRDRFLVSTDQPISLEIMRAYWPGWQATLNGEPTTIGIDDMTGLIRVTLPAVRDGQLVVSLGSTSIRRFAWGISWGMLFLIMARLWTRRHRALPDMSHERVLVTRSDARLLGMVVAGFAFCLLLFARPESPYSLYSRPGYGLDRHTELRIRTGTGMEALAYRLERTEYRMGETMSFTLAWRTSRMLLRNYSVQVALRDVDQGLLWAASRPHYPGGFPTRRWGTEGYILDPHTLHISNVMRPGRYQIAIQIYDCAQGCTEENRVTFYDSEGVPLGPVLILRPEIIILAP